MHYLRNLGQAAKTALLSTAAAVVLVLPASVAGEDAAGVSLSDWRSPPALQYDPLGVASAAGSDIARPFGERASGVVSDSFNEILASEAGLAAFQKVLRDKLIGADAVSFANSLAGSARTRATRWTDDWTHRLLANSEAFAESLPFVRNVDLDYRSELGNRTWQAGVSALGGLRETDVDVLAWQLRGSKGGNSSTGANAGLIYRVVLDDFLVGGNAFVDYEDTDYGGFARWSLGAEFRSQWIDGFVNRYLSITSDRFTDDFIAYTKDGHDFAVELHSPDDRWRGGFTFYEFAGKYGQDDDRGTRYHVALKTDDWIPYLPGLQLFLEFDSGDSDDTKLGGGLRYRHVLGGAAQGSTRDPVSDYDPRDSFYAPVNREYAQRIGVVSGDELASATRGVGVEFSETEGDVAVLYNTANGDTNSHILFETQPSSSPAQNSTPTAAAQSVGSRAVANNVAPANHHNATPPPFHFAETAHIFTGADGTTEISSHDGLWSLKIFPDSAVSWHGWQHGINDRLHLSDPDFWQNGAVVDEDGGRYYSLLYPGRSENEFFNSSIIGTEDWFWFLDFFRTNSPHWSDNAGNFSHLDSPEHYDDWYAQRFGSDHADMDVDDWHNSHYIGQGDGIALPQGIIGVRQGVVRYISHPSAHPVKPQAVYIHPFGSDDTLVVTLIGTGLEVSVATQAAAGGAEEMTVIVLTPIEGTIHIANPTAIEGVSVTLEFDETATTTVEVRVTPDETAPEEVVTVSVTPPEIGADADSEEAQPGAFQWAGAAAQGGSVYLAPGSSGALVTLALQGDYTAEQWRVSLLAAPDYISAQDGSNGKILESSEVITAPLDVTVLVEADIGVRYKQEKELVFLPVVRGIESTPVAGTAITVYNGYGGAVLTVLVSGDWDAPPYRVVEFIDTDDTLGWRATAVDDEDNTFAFSPPIGTHHTVGGEVVAVFAGSGDRRATLRYTIGTVVSVVYFPAHTDRSHLAFIGYDYSFGVAVARGGLRDYEYSITDSEGVLAISDNGDLYLQNPNIEPTTVVATAMVRDSSGTATHTLTVNVSDQVDLLPTDRWLHVFADPTGSGSQRVVLATLQGTGAAADSGFVYKFFDDEPPYGAEYLRIDGNILYAEPGAARTLEQDTEFYVYVDHPVLGEDYEFLFTIDVVEPLTAPTYTPTPLTVYDGFANDAGIAILVTGGLAPYDADIIGNTHATELEPLHHDYHDNRGFRLRANPAYRAIGDPSEHVVNVRVSTRYLRDHALVVPVTLHSIPAISMRDGRGAVGSSSTVAFVTVTAFHGKPPYTYAVTDILGGESEEDDVVTAASVVVDADTGALRFAEPVGRDATVTVYVSASDGRHDAEAAVVVNVFSAHHVGDLSALSPYGQAGTAAADVATLTIVGGDNPSNFVYALENNSEFLEGREGTAENEYIIAFKDGVLRVAGQTGALTLVVTEPGSGSPTLSLTINVGVHPAIAAVNAPTADIYGLDGRGAEELLTLTFSGGSHPDNLQYNGTSRHRYIVGNKSDTNGHQYIVRFAAGEYRGFGEHAAMTIEITDSVNPAFVPLSVTVTVEIVAPVAFTSTPDGTVAVYNQDAAPVLTLDIGIYDGFPPHTPSITGDASGNFTFAADGNNARRFVLSANAADHTEGDTLTLAVEGADRRSRAVHVITLAVTPAVQLAGGSTGASTNTTAPFYTLAATQGKPGYTYAIVADDSANVQVGAASGVLRFTNAEATARVLTVSVSATDTAGVSATAVITINVHPLLFVSDPSALFAHGLSGSDARDALTITLLGGSGAANYSFADGSGNTHSWLQGVAPAAGGNTYTVRFVSGVDRTHGEVGTWNFVVSDSGSNADPLTVTVTVHPLDAVAIGNAPTGEIVIGSETVGDILTVDLAGGLPPYATNLAGNTSGNFQTRIVSSSATPPTHQLILSANAADHTTDNLTLSVAGEDGLTQATLTISLASALSFSGASIPVSNTSRGNLYTFAAKNGKPPYTYAIAGGSSASRVDIDPVSGALGFRFQENSARTYTFDVSATDEDDTSITVGVTVQIFSSPYPSDLSPLSFYHLAGSQPADIVTLTILGVGATYLDFSAASEDSYLEGAVVTDSNGVATNEYIVRFVDGIPRVGGDVGMLTLEVSVTNPSLLLGTQTLTLSVNTINPVVFHNMPSAPVQVASNTAAHVLTLGFSGGVAPYTVTPTGRGLANLQFDHVTGGDAEQLVVSTRDAPQPANNRIVLRISGADGLSEAVVTLTLTTEPTARIVSGQQFHAVINSTSGNLGQVQATGGTPPYTFTLVETSHANIAGLAVDANSGALTFTQPATQTGQGYRFAVQITDADGGTHRENAVIHTYPPIALHGSVSRHDGKGRVYVTTAFAHPVLTLTLRDGVAPYVATIQSGDLTIEDTPHSLADTFAVRSVEGAPGQFVLHALYDNTRGVGERGKDNNELTVHFADATGASSVQIPLTLNLHSPFRLKSTNLNHYDFMETTVEIITLAARKEYTENDPEGTTYHYTELGSANNNITIIATSGVVRAEAAFPGNAQPKVTLTVRVEKRDANGTRISHIDARLKIQHRNLPPEMWLIRNPYSQAFAITMTKGATLLKSSSVSNATDTNGFFIIDDYVRSGVSPYQYRLSYSGGANQTNCKHLVLGRNGKHIRLDDAEKHVSCRLRVNITDRAGQETHFYIDANIHS